MNYEHKYLELNRDLHESDRKAKVEAILKILPENLEINSILDVACGSGNILRDIVINTNSKNNTGVDISKEIIEIASKNSEDINCKWVAMDILNYTQTPVDLVLAIDIVEHIEDDTKLLDKILSLGKYIVLKIPIEDNIINRIVIKLSKGKINPLKDTELKYGHIHHYSLNNVFALINKYPSNTKTINYMHLPKRSKLFWEVIRILFLPIWLFSKKFYIILNGGFVMILVKR